MLLTLPSSSCAPRSILAAQCEGKTFPVPVPAGGATHRQKFAVPQPAVADGPPALALRAPPVGRWKVGYLRFAASVARSPSSLRRRSRPASSPWTLAFAAGRAVRLRSLRVLPSSVLQRVLLPAE